MKKTNNTVNAPATKTAILLDAEREDSKFDYRQAEDILSQSEVDSYEEGKGFFDDEEEKIELGHHKATFTSWESVKETWKTARDGSRYLAKAHLKMTFQVGNLEFTSRIYGPGFKSFQGQMNYTHHGIFNYTKSSVALNILKGEEVDIWVIWNDTLNELQAEFFDRKAWEARKREQAQIDANARKSSKTNRAVENRVVK